MKKILFTIFTAFMGLMMPGCGYDDGELLDRLGNLENRVVSLEQLCQQMNTNISAMQTLVDAIQTQDYITAVTPVSEGSDTIGYTITFAKSDPITIYHGQDGKDGQNGQNGVNGKDGYTPIIGVDKAEDEVYYWTLDGEWLIDEAGNKIRASGKDGINGTNGKDGINGTNGKDGINGTNGKDGVNGTNGKDGVNGTNGKDGINGTNGKDGINGTNGKDGINGTNGKDGKDGITPKLKIESGDWYISYDEGTSWERLGSATGAAGSDGQNGQDGDAYFSSVTVDETNGYVTFVLNADGRTIQIPLYEQFSVEFTSPATEDDSYVMVGSNTPLTISYQVTNPANDNLSLVVISDLKTTLDKDAKTIEVYPTATVADLNTKKSVALIVSNGTTTVMVSVDVQILDLPPGATKLEVRTPEELLRWGYLVNHKYLDLGSEIKNEIVMPAYEIEADHENGTYVFTDTPITVDADGVPSGSNWIPLGNIIDDFTLTYKGKIEGNGNLIKGLRIKADRKYVGFIGAMYDGGSIANLTFEDACVKGNKYTGLVVGRSQNGSTVENVHVKNSHVNGTEIVGGIAGYNYSRNVGSNGTFYGEKISIIKNCSIDKDSSVKGSSSSVGGICGDNTGAAIIYSFNDAQITGSSNVGGIVGYSREYNNGRNAYIIACGSKENAIVTGNGNDVGGVVGQSLADGNHAQARAYTIACYSVSEIGSTGSKKGSLVGEASNPNNYFIASWAKKAGNVTNLKGSGSATLTESAQYEQVSDFSADIINRMNDEIANYNGVVNDDDSNCDVKCHYRWQYNAGGWPTLVEVQQSTLQP